MKMSKMTDEQVVEVLDHKRKAECEICDRPWTYLYNGVGYCGYHSRKYKK